VKKDKEKKRLGSYLAQEPGHQVSKENRLVGLMVIWWGRDPGHVPEIALPLVELVVDGASVEQQDLGCALDQPATVQELDAALLHRLEGQTQLGRVGFEGLDLERCGFV